MKKVEMNWVTSNVHLIQPPEENFIKLIEYADLKKIQDYIEKKYENMQKDVPTVKSPFFFISYFEPDAQLE